MVPRDLFHKPAGSSSRAVFGLIALGVGLAACLDVGADRPDDGRAPETFVLNTASQAETSDLGPLPPAGYAWVIFGADTVVAEVAATADERAQGLMYREEVPDGTGMLFVFQDSQPRSFWMANTYVPLDIAYMDPSYRVVDIVAMEPLVTESYPSDAPAMFALEVRQGWFAAQGIGVGARANIVFGIQGR